MLEHLIHFGSKNFGRLHIESQLFGLVILSHDHLRLSRPYGGPGKAGRQLSLFLILLWVVVRAFFAIRTEKRPKDTVGYHA